MRSAFEIADTNGDGVLTYTEAVEVGEDTAQTHNFFACLQACVYMPMPLMKCLLFFSMAAQGVGSLVFLTCIPPFTL